jgi:cysteine synthase
LYLKDDGANPTGSLKDRASFLVAAFAGKHGLSEVVVASTGNAGSSMAGVGAAAGLKVKLFLPKTAPPAKMIQALQYGADLVLADKNYDQAFSLSLDSGIDNVLELTHYEKKRIHNLKYFTWIEQQGRELSELNDQWYGHVEYRQNIFALAPQIDELIVEFNRQIDAA